MDYRRLGGVVLALLLVAGITRAAVPDADIEAASKEYQRLLSTAREAGERPMQADMGDFVDKVFANIPINQLSLDQTELALRTMPVQFSVKTAKAMGQHLATQSQAATAEGARAAILRFQLLPPNATPEDKANLLKTALSHPGIKDAVAAGYGGGLFELGQSLSAETLGALRDGYLNLGSSVKPGAAAPFFTAAARFFLSVASTLSPEDAKALSPLREAVATALDQKLSQSGIEAAEQKRLQTALDQLQGAFAKGELLGHEAPNIDFIWFNDPADPEHKVKSLADLKGKVVVLDFWATWCGPCIVSFPKVKAVQRYYRGYDVVVIGVTSIQGFHSSPDGRIDTKDDPQKEMALMPDFMKQRDMTWPVAFSKQPVFNPDYGVTGIPNMVIIDANGIVRHVGLHPGVPLAEKTKRIDPLLAEAGKTIPATMIEMKKPD